MTAPLFFEDIEIGKTFSTGYGAPITEKMVQFYCKLTGETNDSHTNIAFAEKHNLEGLVVPGYLLQPLSAGLVKKDTPLKIVLIAESNAKFIKPVYINDCLRADNKVLEKEDRPKQQFGKVVLQRDVYNQSDELCATFLVDLRVAKKGRETK